MSFNCSMKSVLLSRSGPKEREVNGLLHDVVVERH